MSLTSGKSVLIVDDSAELIKLLDKILVNVGIVTSSASSVKEAWEKLKEIAPHAIITDLGMEPESGFDFLEKLKNSPQYSKIPVIVLSARGERSAIHQALALGAKEYVQKPLDATLILQKIKKILHSSQFSTHEYDPEKMPVLEAKVPSSITGASHEGFLIESPVRLARDSSITLESATVGPMKFSRPPTMRSFPNVPKINERGAFLNEVRFLGLVDEQVKQLRDIIRRWHTK